MRISKMMHAVACVTMAITGATLIARNETKKKPAPAKQQAKKGGGFAEKARQLKEQQEQKQARQGLLSNQQEQDLRKLLDDYKKAKSAKEKVRIGSYLMPLAEKYLNQFRNSSFLNSLLKDKEEMQLVGELATVIGDLQGAMKKAGTGIFQKVSQEIKKLADSLLVEEKYE